MKLRIKRLLEKAKHLPKRGRGPGKRIRVNPISQQERLWQELEQRTLRGIGLSLGQILCKACQGVGQVVGGGATKRLCDCVTRQVFRIVFGHYLWLGHQPAVTRWEQTANGLIYGLPGVEFRADFESTAKRVLTAQEHRVFVIYFLRGCAWPQCCRELGTGRGLFFHDVYLIESKLGTKLLRMRPAMFPLSTYFRHNRVIDPKLFAKAKHKRNIKWDYHRLTDRELYVPRP